jgi:hypothetical protein
MGDQVWRLLSPSAEVLPMSRIGIAFPLALLALTLSAPSHAREQLVGHDAYAKAQEGAARRSGGFFRYGWHVTKGAILYGALGAGAGYFLGGPAAAIEWGSKGAIGGSAWRAATGGSKCGVFKRSGRAFAKADLCEAKGQSVRKHYYKVKGIVWSAVEGGVVSGVASGALGTLFGGPASTVPSALGGCALGTAFGAASGICKAYVVPVFRSFSMSSALRRANRALGRLEREPSNPAWRDEVASRLADVHTKKEKMPRLSDGQTRRYLELSTRVSRLATGRPGIATLGANLH